MSNSIGIDTLDRCLTKIMPDLLKLKKEIQSDLQLHCRMVLSCYSETRDLIQELYHITGNADVSDKLAKFEIEYSDVMDLAHDIYFKDEEELLNQIVPSAMRYLILTDTKFIEALSSIEIISALGKNLKTSYINSSMDDFERNMADDLEKIKKDNVNNNLYFHYSIRNYLKYSSDMYSNFFDEFLRVKNDVEIEQRINFLDNKLRSLA